MTATKAKPKYSLDSIEKRVRDMRKNHSEDIDTNAILRFGAGVFGEMEFLLNELKRATGDGLDLKEVEEETDA